MRGVVVDVRPAKRTCHCSGHSKRSGTTMTQANRCRPGWNTVGCSRSGAPERNVLSSPATVTSTWFTLW